MPRKPAVQRKMKITEFDVVYQMPMRGNKTMTYRDRIPRYCLDKKSLMKKVEFNWSDTGYVILDIQNIKLGTAYCTMTEQEYLDCCTITKFEEENIAQV